MATPPAGVAGGLVGMALRSLSDPPSPDGNDDLLCGDPGCEGCWPWPRVGEEPPDWPARLAPISPLATSASPPDPDHRRG